MKRIILISITLLPLCIQGAVAVKVKDIAYIDGLKENQVFGYGLVVGLQGTGDSRINVTRSSLRNLLKNLGLQEDDVERSRNVAAVLVTARLPVMVRVGDHVDVTVSSIGDAQSVEGGMLIQSPLRGANGQTYVVAQGHVAQGGQQAGAAGRNRVRTVGIITNGGIIERDIETTYSRDGTVTLVLDRWDFSLANDIITAVSELYPEASPQIMQNGKITFTIPENVHFSVFIEEILDIEVTPEYGPRVVINEKEGTIVMGGNIRVSEAVVSKDGMKITVNGEERNVSAQHIEDITTVSDVVDALNYTGLSTSDIISILKALKDAGALHAELVIK
ncbi:MAG: flagellar basal body P-ring protein FlgI [Spirochaetota bacterium]